MNRHKTTDPNTTYPTVFARLLRNDATVLILRLAVLYFIWFLCRIVFYWQNSAAIGSIAWSEAPGLLHGSLVFDTVSILYVNALFILLSLLPFRFRERGGYQKMLFWIYGITNSLALIVNISDGVYFHYAQKRFTADELSYISNNDNSLAIIFRALAENWYIVLWALAAILLMLWLYRRIGYAPTRISNKWGYFGVSFALLLAGAALVVGGIRGGYSRSVRPITLSNATLYTRSNLKANLILSNPFGMLRTLENKSIVYEKFFDQATLDAIYTPYHYPKPGMAPTLGRRNVVLFILESFSSEHSGLLNPDLYPDGRGYTPFLDSLMREGYFFTNAFANGRKSIDALPSLFSSIPSYQTPFVLMPQSLSHMESLPWILAQQGYSTSFFNGSARGSMGFGAYASLAGVQDYYSREDYEKARGKADFDGYWGIWDEPFLQYMQQTLSAKPEPFFAAVFTLTSHHPFVVPAQYDSVLPAGKTKVHKGVAYTDLALRRFFEAASGEPWFDNTIFVFVGDHVSSETFAPKTLTPTGNSHIISFIYTPDGVIRGMDANATQQIDVMPTVLGLLGYEKPYFAFGRDVLNEPERMAMAVNAMGGAYQAITDSLVLFFDGRRTLSAYGRQDTLQRNDISADRTPYLERVERELKARLQQYYQHVEQSSYVVPGE